MTALTTRELDAILKNNDVTKTFFLGTYPACRFPTSKKRVYSFITNTDVHDKSGTHWTAWFIRDNKITFMDSFGRHLNDPQFPHYYIDIISEFNKVEYNKTQLQGYSTSTCGYYCIHFIYVLSLGLGIRDFISDYYNDYNVNDSIVLKFVDSIL